MPKKAGGSQQAKKGTRVLRSEEEIKTLMEEILAARASGATLTEALWQRSIPYNTYNKWTKKFGESVAAVPAKQGKAVRGSRSEGEIKQLLGNIAALRKGGTSLKDAVAQNEVSMSSYQYWTNRYGKQKAVAVAALKVPAGASDELAPVVVLQEMLDNRKKREELEEVAKQIVALDARYEELKNRLDVPF